MYCLRRTFVLRIEQKSLSFKRMESTVIRRYMSEQFSTMYKKIFDMGDGVFGSMFAAMEPKMARAVTIKRVSHASLIHQDAEFIAMRKLAEGHCQFMPAFLKVFKVGYDSTYFVFEYEGVKDLKRAWR